MRIDAWIDDRSHEYLLNLVAQGYYSESWEFIQKLVEHFEIALLNIMKLIKEEN